MHDLRNDAPIAVNGANGPSNLLTDVWSAVNCSTRVLLHHYNRKLIAECGKKKTIFSAFAKQTVS